MDSEVRVNTEKKKNYDECRPYHSPNFSGVSDVRNLVKHSVVVTWIFTVVRNEDQEDVDGSG